MPLTFGEIREIVAPYAGRAGKCPESDEVARFSRTVMENLLYTGAQAGLKRVNVIAVKGCIALPQEVEVVLKAKINNRVANIQNQWFSFHSVNTAWERDCCPAGEILIENGSYTPLAYPLPPDGSLIGAMSSCCEDPDANIIIQGKDPTGRLVYTLFRGEQITGEKITLTNQAIKYGMVQFAEIESVLKTKTNGYVDLFAVCPKTNGRRLIGSYTPMEQKPLYRQYKLVSRSCPPYVEVSMLCRVRLKDNYHDNDITFFDNVLAVTMAAQRIQAEDNNNTDVAGYKNQALTDLLNKESDYKKINGSPVDMFFPLSAGTIKNLI